MTASDKKIISIVQGIFDVMHHPLTGIRNKELDIGALAKSRGERPSKTKFTLSGKDIVDGRYGRAVGCTGTAKAFLYLAKQKQLDAIGVVTTELKTYKERYSGLGKPYKKIDAPFNGHVIAAVKLSDGKYHMLDPGIGKFIDLTNPKAGNIMHHEMIPDIKDEAYVITAVTKNLEKINSAEGIHNISISGNVNSNICKFSLSLIG